MEAELVAGAAKATLLERIKTVRMILLNMVDSDK
jgi:hypothetical protein